MKNLPVLKPGLKAVLGALAMLLLTATWALAGITASVITVHGPKQLALGDEVELEFTLTNHGPQDVFLDEKMGVFVCATVTPSGSKRAIKRTLGKSYQGWKLRPGQSLVLNVSQMLDMPGVWQLTPGCQSGGREILFEHNAVGLKVATLASSSQPSVAGHASGSSGSGRPSSLMGFKLMSYNIFIIPERQHEGIISAYKVIASQTPDLLGVQEVSEKFFPGLSKASNLKNYKSIPAYGDEKWRTNRTGLFSRWPIKVTTFKLPGGKKPRKVARAVIDMNGVPVVYYLVHLTREGLVDGALKGILKEIMGQGRRSVEMEALAKRIKADRHRFILLAGDLNTFPMSGPYRILDEVLDDAFPDLMNKGTYRLDLLRKAMGKQKAALMEAVPNPKIDHIFHSPAVMADGAWVIEKGGSDHYPVVARLAIPLESPPPSPELITGAQKVLRSVGILKGGQPGKLDPDTRRALARFQDLKGMAIDGLLLKPTIGALGLAQ